MKRALVSVGTGDRLVLEPVARPDLVDPDAARSSAAAIGAALDSDERRIHRPLDAGDLDLDPPEQVDRRGVLRRCRARRRSVGCASRGGAPERLAGAGQRSVAESAGRLLRRSWTRSVPRRAVSRARRRRGPGRAATWSPTRTSSSSTRPASGRRDRVLHLHRLEGDDGVAGLDRRADRRPDRQDRPGIGAPSSMRPDRRGPPPRRWPRDRRRAAGRVGRPTLRPARSRWTASPTTDRLAGSIAAVAGSLGRQADGPGRPRPMPGGRVGAALSRKPPPQRASPGEQRAPAAAPGLVRDPRALRPVVRRPDPIERVGARLAVADDRLADQPAQEPQVRGQPQHDRLVERAASGGRAPSARSRPRATILASIGSNRPPTTSPSATPASTRTPSPAGQRRRSIRPVAGRKPSSASSAYSRTSTAWPVERDRRPGRTRAARRPRSGAGRRRGPGR